MKITNNRVGKKIAFFIFLMFIILAVLSACGNSIEPTPIKPIDPVPVEPVDESTLCIDKDGAYTIEKSYDIINVKASSVTIKSGSVSFINIEKGNIVLEGVTSSRVLISKDDISLTISSDSTISMIEVDGKNVSINTNSSIGEILTVETADNTKITTAKNTSIGVLGLASKASVYGEGEIVKVITDNFAFFDSQISTDYIAYEKPPYTSSSSGRSTVNIDKPVVQNATAHTHSYTIGSNGIISCSCGQGTISSPYIVFLSNGEFSIDDVILLSDTTNRPSELSIVGNKITYTNKSGTAKDVVLYTNGGDLEVDAPDDTLTHYGSSENVKIVSIASASYDVMGKVQFVQVESGHVNVKSTASVNAIYAGDGAIVDKEITATVTNVYVPQGASITGNLAASKQETTDTVDDLKVESALGGSGTQQDPYIISSRSGFMAIKSKYSSNTNSYFEVDPTSTSWTFDSDGKPHMDGSNWCPNDNTDGLMLFGSIDCKGLIIDNLDHPLFRRVGNTGSTNGVELVNYSLQNSYIKNLTISNCNITDSYGVAAVIRDCEVANMLLENINVTGNIYANQNHGASFIGYGAGNRIDNAPQYNLGTVTFKNCISRCVISGDSCGGFVGYWGNHNYANPELDAPIILEDSDFLGEIKAVVKGGDYEGNFVEGYEAGTRNITINNSVGFTINGAEVSQGITHSTKVKNLTVATEGPTLSYNSGVVSWDSAGNKGGKILLIVQVSYDSSIFENAEFGELAVDASAFTLTNTRFEKGTGSTANTYYLTKAKNSVNSVKVIVNFYGEEVGGVAPLQASSTLDITGSVLIIN